MENNATITVPHENNVDMETQRNGITAQDLMNDLGSEETNPITEESDPITEENGVKQAQALNSPRATKYYALSKLVELFLDSEKGEKATGRKRILDTSILLIYIILLAEFGLIILQGMGVLKLDNVIFLGTIGTITTGAIFLLKTVTKSLYNDESDKVLNTIEKIVEKL